MEQVARFTTTSPEDERLLKLEYEVLLRKVAELNNKLAQEPSRVLGVLDTTAWFCSTLLLLVLFWAYLWEHCTVWEAMGLITILGVSGYLFLQKQRDVLKSAQKASDTANVKFTVVAQKLAAHQFQLQGSENSYRSVPNSPTKKSGLFKRLLRKRRSSVDLGSRRLKGNSALNSSARASRDEGISLTCGSSLTSNQRAMPCSVRPVISESSSSVDAEDILHPNETDAVRELRQRVADVATPAIVAKFGGEIRCYERFVLARQGKLDLAEKMFRELIKFRANWKLDDPDCERTKARLETFKARRHLWPGSFVPFASKDGSPIQLFKFKEVKPKLLMQEVTEEEFAQVYLTWMELTLDVQNYCNTRKFQKAVGNVDLSAPWKSFIEIHDLAGIGRAQLHMQGVLMLTRVLKLGQGNYPENLRMSFICNAPWYFAGAWSVISKILDPATNQKIVVSNKIPRERLRALMSDDDIDTIFGTGPI